MGQKLNMRVGSTSKFNNVFICKKKKKKKRRSLQKGHFLSFSFFSFSPKAKIRRETVVGCKENCEVTKTGSSPYFPDTCCTYLEYFLLMS